MCTVYVGQVGLRVRRIALWHHTLPSIRVGAARHIADLDAACTALAIKWQLVSCVTQLPNGNVNSGRIPAADAVDRLPL